MIVLREREGMGMVSQRCSLLDYARQSVNLFILLFDI